jgi:NRAMP (natural resistance-associated macrophage protein)-like metal ion transporter
MRAQSSVAKTDQKDEEQNRGKRQGTFRAIGLGLITGAADDDPSAIGTYASAGAKFGPALLWTAPLTFPMMFVVVYLSAKLGQVAGRGLFGVIKENFSRWLLYPILIGVLIGNTIEAAADIGGMAAALQTIVPMHHTIIIVAVTFTILVLQIWASYILIRNIFRWLALTLLAYVVSAILAKPDILTIVKGTLIPTIHFNVEFLSILVAIIGTTLSAYLYSWQSNEEVEEERAIGRKTVSERKGATSRELKESRRDIFWGMFFSNIVMYFIILSTGSTLFKAGKTEINSAAEAAEALKPVAGSAAGILFAVGVVAVGFLAVPIMTSGAAYDFAQTVGWRNSLHAAPAKAKKFYLTIAVFTFIAMDLNFFGINPMKALVFAGIVQGFSTPPLLLLILLMTSNKKIMGNRVNSLGLNIFGWVTTALVFAASLCLLYVYLFAKGSV